MRKQKNEFQILFLFILFVSFSPNSQGQSNANWMSAHKDALQNACINQVTLLGSHDAGSYGVVEGAPPCSGYINHEGKHMKHSASAADLLHAICQSGTAYDQLAYGVRYLDLRICKQNGQFMMEHMWVSVPCFGHDGFFSQVKRFLKDNPDEVILLSIWQLWSETGRMTIGEATGLYQKIENEFGELLIPKNQVSKLTYGQIWEGKGRIILFGAQFSDDDMAGFNDPNIWNQQEDSKWLDVHDPQDLIQGQEAIVQGWVNGKSRDKLRVLSSIIDAGKKIEDAARTNPITKQKLLTDWKNAPISVVEVDDSVNSDLIQVLIDRIKH